MGDAGNLVEPADGDPSLDLVEHLLRDRVEHLGGGEPRRDGIDVSPIESSVNVPARCSWWHASRAKVFVNPNSPDFEAA